MIFVVSNRKDAYKMHKEALDALYALPDPDSTKMQSNM
jgi:hypothetical protein